jgi:hypothetical protein
MIIQLTLKTIGVQVICHSWADQLMSQVTFANGCSSLKTSTSKIWYSPASDWLWRSILLQCFNSIIVDWIFSEGLWLKAHVTTRGINITLIASVFTFVNTFYVILIKDGSCPNSRIHKERLVEASLCKKDFIPVQSISWNCQEISCLCELSREEMSKGMLRHADSFVWGLFRRVV